MKYFNFKKREYADCCLLKMKDTQTLLNQNCYLK